MSSLLDFTAATNLGDLYNHEVYHLIPYIKDKQMVAASHMAQDVILCSRLYGFSNVDDMFVWASSK
jgi:hypothetical protein